MLARPDVRAPGARLQTFDSLFVHGRNAAAVAAGVRFASASPQSRVLYVGGEGGAGKSHLASAVANMAEDAGERVAVMRLALGDEEHPHPEASLLVVDDADNARDLASAVRSTLAAGGRVLLVAANTATVERAVHPHDFATAIVGRPERPSELSGVLRCLLHDVAPPDSRLVPRLSSRIATVREASAVASTVRTFYEDAGRLPTIDEVMCTWGAVTGPSPNETVLDPVADAVRSVTGVGVRNLRARRSINELVTARKLFILAARSVGVSYASIAVFLQRDYSTVRSGASHAEGLMQSDAVFVAAYTRVLAAIGKGD